MEDENPTLLEELQARLKSQRTVRRILVRFGVSNWKTLYKPLAQLPEEEVVALLFNWALVNVKDGVSIILRMREGFDHDVYEIQLTNIGREINVEDIKKCDHLKRRLLYYWHPETTYQTLSWKLIRASMELASFTNNQSSIVASNLRGTNCVIVNDQ